MMKKVGMLFAAVAVVALLSAGTIQARPQYDKAFKAAYPDLEGALKEAKCGLCHGKGEDGKENKKLRNNYGEAIGKALEKKNVKDEEGIKAALKKVEAGKSAIDGKTFGDLIKDKKLPSATK